jgi:O-antigen ligase
MIFIALNAVALGAYAFWFHESHAGRVDGVTHAVLFGDVSLFLSFASLALFFADRHIGWRVLAVAGVILGGSASVLSGARGGWVGVPILIVITLIAADRALKLKRSMVVAGAVFIILVLMGLWHTNAVQTRISQARHDLTQLSKNNWRNSLGLRVVMWEQAWKEIRESPLLGTGFSGYRSRIHEAVETGKLPEIMLKFATEPHNEYLYQWMTRGFPGLVVFLACLALAGWYFFRLLLYGDASRVAVGHVGLSLITVVAVSGLTITVIDQRAVIRFLVWIAALLMYCAWLCGKERTTGELPEK